MKKLTLIGPYPPPIGGVSIYIKRLKELLDDNGFYCEVYNEGNYEDKSNNIYTIKNYKSLILKFNKLKGDIIHFNCMGRNVRSILWLLKVFYRNKKMVLTIHGSSLKDQLEESNKLIKYFMIKSLKSMDKIIVVNKFYKELLVEYGIKLEKIKFMSSFIKPINNKKCNIDIPKDVSTFLNVKNFKLVTNGCVTFYNNKDLYGFDNLIEAVSELRKKNIDISLLIAVLSSNNQTKEESDYYLSLKSRVNDMGLGEKILFYDVDNTEFYPLLEKSDLFIRATNTDGDHPISLKEALALGKPSIASDVSIRPKTCIIYESRNVKSLIEKIEFVINNYNIIEEKIKNIEIRDASNEIISLYESLLD